MCTPSSDEACPRDTAMFAIVIRPAIRPIPFHHFVARFALQTEVATLNTKDAL